ncbi:MAG: lipid A 3-O-deacylase [Janthinobacterium sp.]
MRTPPIGLLVKNYRLEQNMSSKNNLLKLLASAAMLSVTQLGFAADDTLIDGAYGEFATGTKTQMIRAGITSNWRSRWFDSNGTHLSGYWDVSVGAWRGNRHQNIPGATQNLFDVGFTPVFRFQRDDKKGFYFEAGIGLHYLSKLYDNDGNQLSTHFQFGDHLGIGYVLDKQWAVGMKIQHFSNGGFRKPNSGVNFLNLKASYRF